MFLRLFSIEWTRLARRALPWLALAACALYTGLSENNYYTSNFLQLANGGMKMPGLSFDLANSLDMVMLIARPFLVILAASQFGSDYAQRTNQHWLVRAPRHTGLLARFAVLAGFALLIHALTVLVGGGAGWYFKTFRFEAFSTANVNYLAVLEGVFYMTLTTLPELALVLLLAVVTRSGFAAAAIGLGYTQFIELLMFAFIDQHWLTWLPHSLYLSVSFLLNDIGNRAVMLPAYLARPGAAMLGLVCYTALFLAAAIWFYRRQDISG